LIWKQRQNSAQLFYDVIFRYEDKNKVGQRDEENSIHDASGESIRGTDLKNLYEKFCYFNGYLERKLDDAENLRLIDEREFKIEVKQDSLTQCYAFVKPKTAKSGLLLPPSTTKDSKKNSIQLYIENFCQQTKFDTDYIEADQFQANYQDFCQVNHLKEVGITETEL
jgi:hypothetical protein